LLKATIPLPGGETAVYNSTGLNFIRHTDWLGSSRLATTWAHAVYSKEAYAPFGETYNEAGTADRSFTGQDQDTVTGSGATGIYDFLFRKYDPAAGRWLSPDPSGWKAVNLRHPQSLNRYAYVENNPMSLTDPQGLSCYYGTNSDGVSVVVDDHDGQGCAAAGVGPGDDWEDANPETVTVNDYDAEPIVESYLDDVQAIGFNLQGIENITPLDVFNWAATGTHVPNGPLHPILNPAGTLTLYYHGNWCGAGGSGAPVDAQDAACMVHDFLYSQYGFTMGSNYDGYNPALQEINQGLCDTSGSAAINLYFGDVVGAASFGTASPNPSCQ